MRTWISFMYISDHGNSISTAPTITIFPRSLQISSAIRHGADDLEAAATITQSAPNPFVITLPSSGSKTWRPRPWPPPALRPNPPQGPKNTTPHPAPFPSSEHRNSLCTGAANTVFPGSLPVSEAIPGGAGDLEAAAKITASAPNPFWVHLTSSAIETLPSRP